MLFGSAAAGEMRRESDVDIAILPEDPNLPLAMELRLQADLARVCQRDVNLVRLDRASTLVLWQIAKHGVVLFEASPWEATRSRARVASESRFRACSRASSGAFSKTASDS
jgi:predicted nucleotidyltransferase